MNKIKEIIVGTNNDGKYKEICGLLPKKIKKYSPKKFKILSPKETGKSFKENSLIKAKYYSKKTNLACLSDDSGLEIDLLKGKPGIYSSRWGGKKNNFNLAIKKIGPKVSIKQDLFAALLFSGLEEKIFLVLGLLMEKFQDLKKEKEDLAMIPYLFLMVIKKHSVK